VCDLKAIVMHDLLLLVQKKLQNLDIRLYYQGVRVDDMEIALIDKHYAACVDRHHARRLTVTIALEDDTINASGTTLMSGAPRLPSLTTSLDRVPPHTMDLIDSALTLGHIKHQLRDVVHMPVDVQLLSLVAGDHLPLADSISLGSLTTVDSTTVSLSLRRAAMTSKQTLDAWTWTHPVRGTLLKHLVLDGIHEQRAKQSSLLSSSSVSPLSSCSSDTIVSHTTIHVYTQLRSCSGTMTRQHLEVAPLSALSSKVAPSSQDVFGASSAWQLIFPNVSVTALAVNVAGSVGGGVGETKTPAKPSDAGVASFLACLYQLQHNMRGPSESDARWRFLGLIRHLLQKTQLAVPAVLLAWKSLLEGRLTALGDPEKTLLATSWWVILRALTPRDTVADSTVWEQSRIGFSCIRSQAPIHCGRSELLC
jgi:hypothetical protein